MPADTARSHPEVNPWIVAVAVMCATFMEILDTTVVNVSLPHIAGSMSATVEESTWALTSYLVACQTYDDQKTADLVKGFLTYVVGTEGQQAAAKQAGSAPLSKALQDEALAIIDKISAK